MTTIRDEQLVVTAVAGGTAAQPHIDQLVAVAVASNPAAASVRIEQLVTVIVSANGQRCVSLGPAISLGCWSPCGTLIAQGL